LSSKELVEKFEQFLKVKLPVVESFHPHFSHAFGEMLDVGGKRFRPLLLLSVVESSKPLLMENALHVALGLVMMHTYSLIHANMQCRMPSSKRCIVHTWQIIMNQRIRMHHF
jgi:farnesyl diphosphate synthase